MGGLVILMYGSLQKKLVQKELSGLNIYNVTELVLLIKIDQIVLMKVVLREIIKEEKRHLADVIAKHGLL